MDPAEPVFLSAGMLVTRKVTRPEYMSAGLLPDRILSASPCLARFLPDLWSIEWAKEEPENRREAAAAFGLEGSLPEVITWVTERFDKEIGWPNILFRLDSAVELWRRFLSAKSEPVCLELALEEGHAERFCEEAEPEQCAPGGACIGRQGVHEALLRKIPIQEGGIRLGFEPLVFDHSLSCSWLCNGLETSALEELGVRPNRTGHIQDFADACRCVEWIERPETGSEPGLWLPWLLIDRTEEVIRRARAEA